MATFSNNMIITKSSLIEVSKELINKRTYKEGTISSVGVPFIKDGIASRFSDENYLIKEGLSLNSEYVTTSFTFEGLIGDFNDEKSECALKIEGDNSLYVYATYNSWIVVVDDRPVLTLSGLTNTEEKVKFTLTFSQTECSLTLFKGKLRYFASVLLEEPIDFTSYTSLILGTDGKNLGQYWKGSIDLSGIGIIQDEVIVYTPSVETSFIFTNILVGDGKYPLNDKSSPILEHVFSFPVEEVSRTGNNILLTVTIPKEVKLNIKEIGLYVKDSASEHLFSLLTGLNLEKGLNLDYNLIMNVKLDINIVNTVAFPEIKAPDVDYPTYSEFEKVQEAFMASAEKLKRMVLLNSIGTGTLYDTGLKASIPSYIDDPDLLKSLYFLFNLDTPEELINPTIEGISYKWPQNYYEHQLDINLWEDNFLATEAYAEIRKRCKGGYTYWEFDKSLLKTEGSATVTDEGIGSLESGEDEAYVDESTETFVVLAQDARYDDETESLITPNAHFSVVGETLQVIKIQSGSISPAYFLSTKFNKWKATVSVQTALDVNNSQVILNFSNSTPNQPLILGIKEGKCYLNIQEPIVLTVRNNEDIQTYTISEQVEIEEENFYSWVSNGQENTILLKDFNPTTESIVYNENGEEITEASITNVSQGTILNEELFPVERTTKYTIDLSYDGEAYKVSYFKKSEDPVDVLNFISHNIISYTENLYFGSEYSNGTFTRAFTGFLFLNLFDIYFYTYEDSELISTTRCFFNIPHEIFYTSLTDFYHIPDCNKSYFVVNNLEETENASYIEVLENNLSGKGDCIDFNTGKGYTLAVKTALFDFDDKIILAKGDLSTEEFYFVLKEENQSIIFELTTAAGEVNIVSYKMKKEELGDFVRTPITITVTISADPSPIVNMYKNNTLLVSKQIGSNTSLTASDYPLVNILSIEDEVYDKRVVIDILGMKGIIEEEDFIRLNAAFNTNL